jgi:acetylornithine deacetylase/succinyl-diaminopimelate desuccinylase-like protein
LPCYSTEKVIEHINKVINDNRVVVKALENLKEPAQVSPIDCEAFNVLNKTIRESFKNTYVSPTLMTASSDSYYYSEVSPFVLPVCSIPFSIEDLTGFMVIMNGLLSKIIKA